MPNKPTYEELEKQIQELKEAVEKYKNSGKEAISAQNNNLKSALGITEQKLSREALGQSEEKYRFIADRISDVILMCDANGNYTYVSPSHRILLGRGEELIGLSIFEHIHPDDVAPMMKVFSDALESGERAKGEYRYWHPERGYIWLESAGKRYIDQEYRVSAIITSRDITDRKQVEAALRESEERLFNIIEFFPDGILAIDMEKRVTIWNKAIEEMTGIPASEMIGKGDHVYTIPFYGEARLHLMVSPSF